MNSPKRLFLIDGMAIAYRAHFAFIRNPLVTSDGRHVSAAYGFVKSVLKIIQDESPDYLAVVFDAKEKTFRHEVYPEYKATREKMPFELRPQIGWIKDILDAMNIPVMVLPGYEADDLIGTLAVKWAESGVDTYMVSGDKDFMQLVNDRIFLYSPATGKRLLTVYGKDEVKKKWGVRPDQIIDLLALMGDASDNVPGIPGIGEKTAVKLLAKYGNLESVLDHAAEQTNKRVLKALTENRESGMLSRRLVTIKTDVPVSPDPASMAFDGFNRAALLEKLQDMEFYGLINDLHLESEPEDIPQDYRIIRDRKSFDVFLDDLKKESVFAFDTETDSTDANRARLVGMSFCREAGKAWYLPLRFLNKERELFADDDTEFVLKSLKQVLENPEIRKVGHNIKYDALVLRKYGIVMQGIFFDTMIAEYLINPDSNSYKLDNLAQHYLNYRMQPIESLIGSKKSTQITMDFVALNDVGFYAAEDADMTWKLYGILEKKLKEESLTEVFRDIEMPLVDVLTDMEDTGVYLNTDYLNEMKVEISRELARLTAEIYEEAGERFNINSPKQLGFILFEKLKLPVIRKTKTGYSTNVTVLETLKNQHRLPALVLEFRTLAKLLSTYVDALPNQVNTRTGRIHTSFNQTVASTGRLSSTDPNFQNIPIRTKIGRKIRHAFVPQEEGRLILAADYSQIELRIMAHLSGDEKLRQAFLDGADVHARTAALVFGVPEADVTPDQRRTAKVVNFGIMYGAGPFRLSNELSISRQEAGAVIKSYFDQYSGLSRYIESVKAFARDKGYVQTLSGRRRNIRDIASENRNLREASERAAVNMPVQGTAADLIKLAMIRVRNAMRKQKMKSRMILQVHDELVFEAEQNELEKLTETVRREMESAMELTIPLKVDIGTGDSWFEAH